MSALVGAQYRLIPAALIAVVVAAAAVTGVAIGAGRPLILVLAALPLVGLGATAIAFQARWVLFFAAFAAAFYGSPLTDRLALGGAGIWISDLLVAAAVGGWLVEWMMKPSARRPRLNRTAVLGVPCLLFALALLIAAARGHERYGTSIIGMPLRLGLYAAIATTLTGLTPRQALHGLTIVFYVGAVFQAGVASFHLATGTSATEHLNLSTGGIRYIGLAAGTYAAGTVWLALLNLSRDRRHSELHLAMLAISSYTVLVAYYRTVYLALGIVILVGLLSSSSLRRTTFAAVPLLVPFLVVGVLGLATLQPKIVTTFTERLSTPASQDESVTWRGHAYQAVLTSASEEHLLGIGFGRETSFSINGQPNVVTGDPHNGYIYVYVGGGIVALAALILVMLVFLLDVARRWRWADEEGRTLLAFVLGTWLIFMIHSASEPIFTSPLMILSIWSFMVLPSLVRDSRPRDLTGGAPLPRGLASGDAPARGLAGGAERPRGRSSAPELQPAS